MHRTFRVVLAAAFFFQGAGTWSTPRGNVPARATFSTVEDVYPDVYRLWFNIDLGVGVPESYWHPFDVGWFRRGGSLRATNRGGATEEVAEFVFRKVGGRRVWRPPGWSGRLCRQCCRRCGGQCCRRERLGRF